VSSVWSTQKTAQGARQRARTLYLLVWMELGPRRVQLGKRHGIPPRGWITQQALNLTMVLQEKGRSLKVLSTTGDTKFSGPFDEVFRSDGKRIAIPRSELRTPSRSANDGEEPSG
jgi:hypothetical protein